MTMLVALALFSAGLVKPIVLPDLRPAKASFGGIRAAGSAFAVSLAPAVAFAAEVAADVAQSSEELEYGTVSAPDFILPLGAGLAILTALLPIALKGGDEAARAMQERDAESFGKSMDSVAPKRKDE